MQNENVWLVVQFSDCVNVVSTWIGFICMDKSGETVVSYRVLREMSNWLRDENSIFVVGLH